MNVTLLCLPERDVGGLYLGNVASCYMEGGFL